MTQKNQKEKNVFRYLPLPHPISIPPLRFRLLLLYYLVYVSYFGTWPHPTLSFLTLSYKYITKMLIYYTFIYTYEMFNCLILVSFLCFHCYYCTNLINWRSRKAKSFLLLPKHTHTHTHTHTHSLSSSQNYRITYVIIIITTDL